MSCDYTTKPLGNGKYLATNKYTGKTFTIDKNYSCSVRGGYWEFKACDTCDGDGSITTSIGIKECPKCKGHGGEIIFTSTVDWEYLSSCWGGN